LYEETNISVHSDLKLYSFLKLAKIVQALLYPECLFSVFDYGIVCLGNGWFLLNMELISEIACLSPCFYYSKLY
jgi:hypothetical protein